MEHYFLERAYSIIIYAVLAVVMFFWMQRKKCNIKLTLWVYTLILTILSYFFIPAETLDLYRLWQVSEWYRGLPLSDMVSEVFAYWSGSALSHLYLAFLYNIDKHLIPAVTAFLFFNNIFYIIGDYSSKKRINHAIVALVLFFFISRGIYGEVISGIRSMLAFSFVARCVYNEVYNKTSIIKNIPIYLFAAFFHQAALVLVAIRFAFYIIYEKRGLGRVLYLIVLASVSALFAVYFRNNITDTITKANVYINSNIFSYVWEYALSTCYMLVCVWLLYYPYRNPRYSLEFHKMRKIVGSIFLICIVLFFTFSIYDRYINFASFIVSPALMEVLNDEWIRKCRFRYTMLIFISTFILIISGLRGDLNAIRFFK